MAISAGTAIIGIAGSLLGGLFSSSSSRANARAAEQAARLQWEIADRVQKREEELFKLWRDEYKACEITLKNEICSMPEYVPQYETASHKAIAQVRKQFSRARRDALACLDAHCVGAYCGLAKDLAIAEANATAWAATTALRTEEALKLQRDQLRREEKYRIAAFGRQHYGSTAAASLAANVLGQQAAAARQAASSNSSAAGYYLQQAFRNLGDYMNRPDTGPTISERAAPANPADFGYVSDPGAYQPTVTNLSGDLSLDDALLTTPFETPMI